MAFLLNKQPLTGGGRYPFTPLFFITLFCTGLPYTAVSAAQPSDTVLSPGYYTVIAAYRPAQRRYLALYLRDLANEGIYARCGADPTRAYLYAYLAHYANLDTAVAAMYRLRKGGRFARAWIRAIGHAHDDTHPPILSTVADDTASSHTVRRIVEPTAYDKKTATAKAPTQCDTFGVQRPSHDLLTHPTQDSVDQKMQPGDVIQLILSLTDGAALVEGEVAVIDTDRSRRMGTLPANIPTRLPNPDNRSGRLTLKAALFGYRPQQVNVHFRLTPSDTLQPFITRREERYVIQFEMIRYRKGDRYAMDNVYFYNNAAIMLPGSQIQLEKLLKMMQEDPDYTIRLHGHTNGKIAGELITMGPRNLFFTLSDDVKEGFGSALRLAKERALTIKKWLMQQGIASDRIKIKAWGGKKMLYDQRGANADKNVRVEVEILKH